MLEDKEVKGKKWFHQFSEVNSILYVASLSEFDMTLFEDEATNRMKEALNVFEKTIQHTYFKDIPIILFLNKSDLFYEKLKKKNLSETFPEYKGKSKEDALKFIESKYVSKNKNSSRSVYVHVTTATDTKNIEAVWEITKDVIMRNFLESMGILQ